MPEEVLNIPREFRIEQIKRHIKKYANRGNEDEILSWSGFEIVYSLFYLYLFKKYNQTCIIKTHLKNFNFGITLDLTKKIYFIVGKNISDERDGSDAYNIKASLSDIAMSLAECIGKLKHEQKNIIIPLTLKFTSSYHANILIYNKIFNTLTLFEPEGMLADETNTLKNDMLKYFTDRLNQYLHLSDKNKIKYEESESICPTRFFNIWGFQQAERNAKVKKEFKEGGGYCAIWSLFFTELTLANPNIKSKDLYNDVIDYIAEAEGVGKIGDYLRYIARGYVKIVNEKFKKYFNKLYDVDITNIDDYIVFIEQLSTETYNKYWNITQEYITIQYIYQGRPINDIYEAYTRDAELAYYKKQLSNPESSFAIQYNIVKKMYNKQLARTPTSRSMSFSSKSKQAIDVIEQEIDEIIPDNVDNINNINPIKSKLPCKPGKERNANGRCVKIKEDKIEKIKYPIKIKEKIKSPIKIKEKTIKMRPPCKSGKERNEKGRCVKIKDIKTMKKMTSMSMPSLQLSSISSSSSLSLPEPYMSSSPKMKTVKIKPPCKPGKMRNANGRCVKYQTSNKTLKLKTRPPCKPGKERNANGRCVKQK